MANSPLLPHSILRYFTCNYNIHKPNSNFNPCLLAPPPPPPLQCSLSLPSPPLSTLLHILGTRIIYDRRFLLQMRNSPLSKSPPSKLATIPDILNENVGGSPPLKTKSPEPAKPTNDGESGSITCTCRCIVCTRLCTCISSFSHMTTTVREQRSRERRGEGERRRGGGGERERERGRETDRQKIMST